MNSRSFFLAAAVVASGCGDYNFTPIPECSKSQVVTGDGKALKCVDFVPSGAASGSTDMSASSTQPDLAMSALAVPTCGAGRCLTGDNAGRLQCVDISMTNATIVQQGNDIASLLNRVSALEKQIGMQGHGAGATWVGNSKMTPSGNIAHAGFDTGLPSAAAFCSDDYGAGSHMCTTQEMYESVVSGVLTRNKAMAKAWVYAPSWQNPTGKAVSPALGLADNCAGYTYPTAHLGWTGMAVEWTASPSPTANGAFALLWHGGSSDAACNLTLPIACCK